MMTLIYYFVTAHLTFAAPACQSGDLKSCQDYLKSQHRKGKAKAFAAAYDDVCLKNPTFSCVKIIVRADMNIEMKEQAKWRGPKAALYNITLDGEKFIYVLNEKSDAN